MESQGFSNQVCPGHENLVGATKGFAKHGHISLFQLPEGFVFARHMSCQREHLKYTCH